LAHFPIKWTYLVFFPQIPRWATSVWPDFFTAGLVAGCCLALLKGRFRIPRICALDIIAIAWTVVGLLFTFFSRAGLGPSIYGFRMTYYPVAFYFFARLIGPSLDVAGFARFCSRLVVGLCVLNSVLLVLPAQWIWRIYREIGFEATVFWIGESKYPRYASILGSPVEFGSLLMFAFIGFLVLSESRRAVRLPMLLWIAFNLFWTASTGAFLGLAAALAVFFVVRRRYALILSLAGVMAVLILTPQLSFVFRNKLRPLEIYFRSADGIRYLPANPWGFGVGSSGHASVRFVRVVEPGFFADIATDHWAHPFVKTLYERGMTAGCGGNPLRFCPEADLTRIQLAVFLSKLQGFDPAQEWMPAVVKDIPDLPSNPLLRRCALFQLERGNIRECPVHPGHFCPGQPVSRGELADIVVRAVGLQPLRPNRPTFDDVPATAPFWPSIERAYSEKITVGYSDKFGFVFKPDLTATRAQAAVFLVKAFKLPYELPLPLMRVTDSWYVKTAIEVGIPGLLLFLLFLLTFFRRVARHPSTGFQRRWLLMSSLFLIGFSVQAIGSNTWDFFLAPHFLWFVLGIATCVLYPARPASVSPSPDVTTSLPPDHRSGILIPR
ncbi:MAG: S-layer homology domain-containing protein, partial [Acidobacteria bacterium]